MYKRLITQALYKQAESIDDSLRGNLSDFAVDSLLPGVGTSADLLGILSSRRNDKTTKEDILKADEHPEWAYIPGVDSYRKVQRARFVEKALNKNKDKDVTMSEVLGPYTSGILATGLGAGIGGLVSKGDRLKGVRRGAIAGLSTAIGMHLVGLLAGAIKKKRTKEQQEKYYDSSMLPNYLIPGVSRYNLSMTTKLVKDVMDKRKDKK